jgi:hypothetical protein
MANKSRGEVDLKLGDHVFVLRPSYEAQQLIEAELGERLFPFANRVTEGDMGVRDVVTVIKHGRIANGRDWTEAEIGEAVVENGLENVIVPVVEFLSNAVRGWQDEKKKEVARSAKENKASQPSAT